MVGGQGNNFIRGGLNIGRGYNCSPSVGTEDTNTSRNLFAVSEGESNMREHDGTIDLLSRVGMHREDDADSNDKGES